MKTQCKIIFRYGDGRFMISYLLNGRRKHEVVK